MGFKPNDDELYLVSICATISSQNRSQFIEQVTNNMDPSLRCACGNMDIVEHVLFDKISSTGIKITDAVFQTNDLDEQEMVVTVIYIMSMFARMPFDIIFGRYFYITRCVSAIMHRHFHIFVCLRNKIKDIMEINPARSGQYYLDLFLILACQYQLTSFCEVLSPYKLQCNNNDNGH